MLTLVNASKENMQRELVSNLYKEELYDELLYESDEVGLKRKVFINLKYFINYASKSNYGSFSEMYRGIDCIETSQENYSTDGVNGRLETTTKQFVVIGTLSVNERN